MLKNNGIDNLQSLEDVFKVIRVYRSIKFRELLKEINRKKIVSINKIFYQLQAQGYYMSIELLYNHFNASPKSNRFPPQDFILAFSESLQLPNEQTQLLMRFWLHYKLLKRYH